jgi:multisubunit Na+/H+ antiporter MnhB subunit
VTAELAFDLVLAAALVVVAWRTLGSDGPREGVVLFIAFGLLSALAWARLGAPDIALVEAAVGTGLTGALLMSALSWADSAPRPRAERAVSWVLPLALVVGLLVALRSIAEPRAGLSPLVRGRLHESGVEHPVTAVLLNFRGYDTLLEIMVLVVVAAAVREVRPVTYVKGETAPGAEPLLDALVPWLLALFVLVAAYLVWKGAHAPGGAFQAGAILAGGGVLFLLSRVGRVDPWRSRAALLLLLVGPSAFLSLAVAPLFFGGALLEYPDGAAGQLIFGLEALLASSIAVALVMFFPQALIRPPSGVTERAEPPP